jgi:hypothetical protein
VELTLPPNASGTVDGRTHNGDIVTEFGLAISGDEDKSVSGRIGSGKATVSLSADVGDIHIKHGSGFPAEAPTASAPPPPPNAPHLKAPKTPPAQPVVQ